jgi:hypothetical protein
MADKKGYYSVIQYLPDPARAEAVNVGVLLFCPDLRFIEARTRRDNDRVRRMFGQHSFDSHKLNAAKQSIEMRIGKDADRFQTLDDLEKFIASRGNEIVLTPARSLRVSGEPKALLESLMDDLVGASGREESRPKILALDVAMNRVGMHVPIQRNVTVEVPTLGTHLRVPYAFQNGVLNLVQPQVFRSSPIQRASEIATAGRLLHKYPDKAGQARRLVVVSEVQVAEPEPDLKGRITNLFRDFDTLVVWSEEIESFADEVQRKAH